MPDTWSVSLHAARTQERAQQWPRAWCAQSQRLPSHPQFLLILLISVRCLILFHFSLRIIDTTRAEDATIIDQTMVLCPGSRHAKLELNPLVFCFATMSRWHMAIPLKAWEVMVQDYALGLRVQIKGKITFYPTPLEAMFAPRLPCILADCMSSCKLSASFFLNSEFPCRQNKL